EDAGWDLERVAIAGALVVLAATASPQCAKLRPARDVGARRRRAQPCLFTITLVADMRARRVDFAAHDGPSTAQACNRSRGRLRQCNNPGKIAGAVDLFRSAAP